MPYENEYAQYKPLRRLAESKRVHELLGEYELQDLSEVIDSSSMHPVLLDELDSDDWLPDYILAMDGSHLEVAVQNGYPGAEASYLTIAAVLIDVAKMRELDANRPVNPREFRTLEKAEAIDCALPGCNIISKGEISAKSSLRGSLYKVLDEFSPVSEEETLLETYEILLEHKPKNVSKSPFCPYEDCPTDARYTRSQGKYECQCDFKRNWYSTDALRIHERMNPSGSNGAIFSEIMQVLERVLLINILRVWEKRRLLSVLKRVAIVMDGPLAVFGQPAWLSDCIRKELTRLNEVAKSVNGKDILLLGVEKSGSFVDHFEQLDRDKDNVADQLPKGSVLLFDDDYIKQHIIFSESTRPYGLATFFGRKFGYKTKSGAKIIASLPYLNKHHADLRTAEPEQFPRLADALHMIDHLVSSRYPNALTPVASAHAEASIPLNIGTKVLENLAKDIIEDKKT